jgi:hypothetical protein
MSSHRRVVRTNSSESELPIPVIQMGNPIWKFFIRIFRFIWCTIRIVWYWFERFFLIVFLIGLTVGLAWWLSQKPSLYRDWSIDQSLLPTISFSGDLVTVENARDFVYTTPTAYIPQYYNRTYDINDIEAVNYIIEPFSNFDGPAHTMLSFTFSWGIHLVVSAEIRKEKWESFDAVLGVLNQYEIVYILGSENDLIKLRTNYRKDEVYMYPIQTPKEKIQKLFLSMMHRADKLSREPEFYNTLWNTCTTNILSHVNRLREEKIAWNKYVLLPSHSDEIVYQAGLINTKFSLDEARKYYRIDELARNANGNDPFSESIRKSIQ